jgi:tRNA (cytidine/uridine-2'-O-)-methyltransferase
LDYHEYADLQEHPSFEDFRSTVRPRRIYALSTKGLLPYAEALFNLGDALVFGPETRGLSQGFLEALPETQRLFIPMMPENRSLNLSNAVALVLYEAWRQNGFNGASRLLSRG